MKSLAIRYGLIMFVGFVVLFMVIYAFGLAQYHELRLLNGIIHMGVMYMMIRAYRRMYPETRDNYVKGTIAGMMTSTLGVLAYTAFVFFFLELDLHLFTQLRNRSPLPEWFSPFNASLYVAVEGLVVSLVGAYIVTRVVDARYDHSPAEGKVTQSLTPGQSN